MSNHYSEKCFGSRVEVIFSFRNYFGAYHLTDMKLALNGIVGSNTCRY